jgi:hypothetical protein
MLACLVVFEFGLWPVRFGLVGRDTSGRMLLVDKTQS